MVSYDVSRFALRPDDICFLLVPLSNDIKVICALFSSESVNNCDVGKISEYVPFEECIIDWDDLPLSVRDFNYFSLLNIAVTSIDCIFMERKENVNYVDIYYLTNQCNREKQHRFGNVFSSSLISTLWIGEECVYGDFKHKNNISLIESTFENKMLIFRGIEFYMLLVNCCVLNLPNTGEDLLFLTFGIRRERFLKLMGFKKDHRKLNQVKNFFLYGVDFNFMNCFLVIVPERLFLSKKKYILSYSY